MAILYRVRRTQVNSAPNTIDVPGTGQNIALVWWRASNYSNSSDSWISFHNDTSGTVFANSPATDYGRHLVPGSSVYVSDLGTEQNPLFYFPRGLTVCAFSSETGTANPTNQLTIECLYYK